MPDKHEVGGSTPLEPTTVSKLTVRLSLSESHKDRYFGSRVSEDQYVKECSLKTK